MIKVNLCEKMQLFEEIHGNLSIFFTSNQFNTNYIKINLK